MATTNLIREDMRQDGLPVFRQVANQLHQQIENGVLRPGDMIPSERDLAEQLGISRMTARAALVELARDGLVNRRQGMGTVVSQQPINKSVLGFSSFTEEMKARGLRSSSRVLQLRIEVADASIGAQLNLPPGGLVVFLERVRLANESPMALERVFLPADKFPNLPNADLANRSLYDILERDFDCRPALANETIEAVALSAHDARLLGLKSGSPALVAQRVTREERGTVIEVVKTIYRADRYRMVLARQR